MTPALNMSFAYTKRKVRFAPKGGHYTSQLDLP
jgi:hypothetical protein